MEWIKKGHIFKPTGEFDWSKGYAQIPRVLVLKDRIRIFYATRYFDSENLPISQTSFIDVDINNFENILYIHNKPSLNLGDKGSFSEFGIHPTMLLPVKKETYFFYQGWQRGKDYPYITEIGIAKSKDYGFTFIKDGETPIISRSFSNPYYVNGVFIFEKEDYYVMFYSSGKEWIKTEDRLESVYQIKRAVSYDLIHWQMDNTFCIEPNLDNECQNSATVLYFEGKYHMWFCFRPALDFRNLNRGYRIGYAWSNDTIVWNRNDSLAGIDVSKDVAIWDSQMVCYPYVFKVNNKIYMLYCGNYFGKTGFGYAELKI